MKALARVRAATLAAVSRRLASFVFFIFAHTNAHQIDQAIGYSSVSNEDFCYLLKSRPELGGNFLDYVITGDGLMGTSQFVKDVVHATRPPLTRPALVVDCEVQ